MTDRIDAARQEVIDIGLGRNHVAYRLLSPKVSLTWAIACEAAEEMVRMQDELKILRREVLLSQQREVRAAMYRGEG